MILHCGKRMLSVMLKTLLKLFQTTVRDNWQENLDVHHVTLNEAEPGRAACWNYHSPHMCNLFGWPTARYLADCSQQVAARMSKAPWDWNPEHIITIAVQQARVYELAAFSRQIRQDSSFVMVHAQHLAMQLHYMHCHKR